MARRTKKTPTREEVLFEALRQGNTRTCAAALAGIDHATFYRWIADDATFRDNVTRAEAEAEMMMVESLKEGAVASRDWRAAESWLKRRRREDWGDSIDVRKLSDEQIVTLLERVADPGSPAPGTGPAGVGATNGNGKH
jgi:glucose-6-phosphate dehydrogenase assembly protein OpcA